MYNTCLETCIII